jgi:hypothetical protein
MSINQIAIHGTEKSPGNDIVPDESLFVISRSFHIMGLTREEMQLYNVDLKEDEIVEFVFDDDTTWMCDADTLIDLFPEAENQNNRSKAKRFTIPAELTDSKGERGIIQKVSLKMMNILTRKAVHVTIEKLAKVYEEKHLENKLGLYAVNSGFELVDFTPDKSEKPYCLLIHGTASSIAGSFGDAWQTDLGDSLQSIYGNRILGFQHRTLTENPFQNVMKLITALPDKSTLHLITTSRGGLVGEILSRFCNCGDDHCGFTNAEMDVFNSYPAAYAEEIHKEIASIRQELSHKEITIEKFIRIACPAAGTTLASNRLDFFLNVTLNLIGLVTGMRVNPAFVAFKNLLSAVIGSKNKVDVLPGVEAMKPNSPIVRAILKCPSDKRIKNSLVVISGNSRLGFNLKALLILASKLFFRQPNDLIVDSRSMSLGTPRTGKIRDFLYEGKDISHFTYFENKETCNAVKTALINKWGESLPGFVERQAETRQRDDLDLTYIEIENPLLRLTYMNERGTEETPITVGISQGDLKYARYPLLAGHFKDDAILYAEKQIDNELGGRLGHDLQLGNYPGRIGESENFLINGKGFKGAVIVGLGYPEDLTPSELTNSVERAVINYLFHQINQPLENNQSLKPAKNGISSLIIGSGYGGLSVDDSIGSVIQGVCNANTRIKSVYPHNGLTIEHIEFIEIYEDKALNGLYFLDKIKHDDTNTWNIVKDGLGIKLLMGSKKRLPRDDNHDWWNRLTVTKPKGNGTVSELKFSSSTRGAREIENTVFTSPSLMQEAIDEFSTNHHWTTKRAKMIFEMLIPNDYKDELKKHGNILWVLDKDTAAYPWELLQEQPETAQPICISSGMIRQLKTPDSVHLVRKADQNKILVIADPNLEGLPGQLDGARREGQEVSKIFESNNIQVNESIGGRYPEIMEQFFGDDYRFIHLSGHGTYHKDPSIGSGMVIGKNQYLSTREFRQKSKVPEFVFVNCCNLGKTNGIDEKYYQQRYRMAANIGTELIEMGVRCVIAAGWAVNDDDALDFARCFYTHMFSGESFGNAVKEARKKIFGKNRQNNTWGAYQCYGDPHYKFRLPKTNGKKAGFLIAKEAEIELENLLEELMVGDATTEEFGRKLGEINEGIGTKDFRNQCPRIIELEALIYFELRSYDKACEKFRVLMTGGQASFSFTSYEYYHNARAKYSIEKFRSDANVRKGSLSEVDNVIGDLSKLHVTGRTPESLNILASTYKRRGFLLVDIKDKKEAYVYAAYFYNLSFSEHKKWYALTNCLILESILVLSGEYAWEDKIKTRIGEFQLKSFKSATRELTDQEKSIGTENKASNYWDMVAKMNIRLCRFIMNYPKPQRSSDSDKITESFRQLWGKAGSKSQHFAEIEHIEFILDALSFTDPSQTRILSDNLLNMKKELEALIS